MLSRNMAARCFAVKVDMEKAYDHLMRWDFIEEALQAKKSFRICWDKAGIMGCRLTSMSR